MKIWRLFGFWLLLMIVLSGCIDPLGATTRSRIRTQAALEVARFEAETARYSARQETVRTGLVVAVVPWILLIVAGGVIGALVVNWQGRIWYARTQAMLASSQRSTPTPRRPAVPPTLAQLRRAAQQQGMQVIVQGNQAWLLDQQGRVRGRRWLTEDNDATNLPGTD
jgi:hypothetical protein